MFEMKIKQEYEESFPMFEEDLFTMYMQNQHEAVEMFKSKAMGDN